MLSDAFNQAAHCASWIVSFLSSLSLPSAFRRADLVIAFLVGFFLLFILRALYDAWLYDRECRAESIERRRHEQMVKAQNLTDLARILTLKARDRSRTQLNITQAREFMAAFGELMRDYPDIRAKAIYQAIRDRAGKNRRPAPQLVNITEPLQLGDGQ